MGPENNNETSTMMHGIEHGSKEGSPPPLPGDYHSNAPEQGKAPHGKRVTDIEPIIEGQATDYRCFNSDQVVSIIAYVRDERQKGWGKVCEITNLDGYPHRIIIPLSDFAGEKYLFRKLLSLGIPVPTDRKSRNKLRDYLLYTEPLDGRRALTVRKCGWHNRVFVMPDRAIGTPPEMIVYDPGANSSATARFAVQGSTAQWQDVVGALCVGNSRLIFSVCCSFAAATLTPLGIEGGCFNLVCASTAGKTTSLIVSASACGGPDYLRSWWTTENGLAKIATGHNDCLLPIDEMGQGPSDKIGEIIYMLINGTNKVTASINATNQVDQTWRLLVLSSGEITISDHMSKAGKKIMPGQEVRMVDIPADAGAGYGIFECLHGFESPEKLAMTLKHNASQTYGAPLVEFLEKFTADFDNGVALVNSFMEDFLSQYQPPDATPQQRRVIRRFAVVAAAGELATLFGVTGWLKGEAMRGVAKCFRDWWDHKHGFDRQEANKIVKQVHRFLENQNGCRFYDLHDLNAPDNESTCFRDQSDGQVVKYFIRPDVFHKEACTGFDPAKVCQVLKERGILMVSEKRNTMVQRVKAYGNKGIRFYCLSVATATGDNSGREGAF